MSVIAQHEARISDELVTALRRLAGELSVSLSSVLLSAHAKVLAALSGEREVWTAYGSGAPFRLTTEPETWRALLQETYRLLEQFPSLHHSKEAWPREEESTQNPLLTRGRGGLPDEKTTKTTPSASASEASRHLVSDAATPPCCDARRGIQTAPAMHISLVEDNGLVFQLQYRTDVFNADCAARIAGYHLKALALIADNPDAEHMRQSLLSAEELQFQLTALAGPRRRLPDRRVHELFEERVREHPEAVAAVHGSKQWTYRQLNGRANQLARALLARGLRREEVVAVVTARNLDWMAAVLAIFKAGGAYLPIEPHFPADRIASTLSRAGCRLVLTERGSTATLHDALESLSAVQTVFIDAAYAENHADGYVGINVEPNQLAYIYFTSGSTGEPKGAMCEHAGMLNHVFAKIQDLGIDKGDVVAQTAPQCFDISLWQLLCALVIGGRTLIVEQDVILDAARFIDKLVEARVAVAQVVPSYLEVLVAYLAQNPRALPDLRCVSATGEALKKELVQRWFAVQPAIKLVNAYGLTETSDDTNHEVMSRVPEQERVPLGHPINNVHIYVVDEHLSPVPLGAPGEIVFSGICVGRGYINDPERTRQAFMADPYRQGERLYRSGDYGRWLPDGKLEFLGRRDAQVKVSGFRIEIGEIENRLLRVAGIADGAVVVTGRADHNERLVAFYSGDRPLDPNVLRQQLRASLPEYMIPSAFHWRSRLPLTGNGKIDRKALMVLANELHSAGAADDTTGAVHARALTPTEERLAAAWAEVLAIPKEKIRREDSFFDLGGTSLSAVKLAVRLERAVSLKELAGHAILADLATLIDGRSGRHEDDRMKGNQDVEIIRDFIAETGPATRKAADAAGSVRRRRSPLDS